MLIWILFPLAFLPSSLCQYAMRPDVVFGEYNDRYDVENIVKDQQQLRNDNANKYRRRIDDQKQYIFHANDNTKEDVRYDTFDGALRFESSNKKSDLEKNKFIFTDNNNNLHLRRFSDGDTVVERIRNGWIKSGDQRKPKSKHRLPKPERRSMDESMDYSKAGVYSKRSLQGETDSILFEHAVPVKFGIEGFLQLPLEDVANK